MTDAEPASSPEAQVQVKFRPGIQVTALTPFPFAFYSFRLLPESQHYYIPFNAFNSRLRRRRGQVRWRKIKGLKLYRWLGRNLSYWGAKSRFGSLAAGTISTLLGLSIHVNGIQALQR